ncbi:integrator complex subunit 8-like [Glandiceps talaboti]
MSESVNTELSNRQDTPTLPVVWYEFVLNANLLEEHLSQEKPDPGPIQLIADFLEHAAAQSSQQQTPVATTPQATEGQGSSTPGTVQNNAVGSSVHVEKKRTKMLKSLALQTAAHLNWNLNVIQTSLQIHLAHGLLTDFLRHTQAPVNSPIESLDFANIDDYKAVALFTYHRWCVRSIVLESFPVKPVKPSTLQGVPEIAQVQPAVKESILKTITESIDKSIAVLELLLKVSRNFQLPTPRAVRQLADSAEGDGASTSTSETPTTLFESKEELTVPVVELHCQVAYDLGCVYFYQFQLREAADRFALVSELLPKISSPVYCFIDFAKFSGYCAACQCVRAIPVTVATVQNLHQKIEQSRRNKFEGLIDLLIEDNNIKDTPMSFRNSLESQILEESSNPDLYYEVCTCNAVRLMIDGYPVSPEYKASYDGLTEHQWNFLFQVCWKCGQCATLQEQTNIKTYIIDACITYQQAWPILCTSDAKQLFTNNEISEVETEIVTLDSVASVVIVDEPRREDLAENKAVLIGQLEQELITCNDPRKIQELLSELQKLTPGKRYSTICDKWQISKSYSFIIDGMGNSKTQDLVFLMLVKAAHCTLIENYSAAKTLLQKGHETVKDLSFKLAKAINQEILYVEMLDENTDNLDDNKKDDYIKRILACLMTSSNDIHPRDEIVEQCIAFLLNTRSWNVLLDLKNRSPYTECGKLIANVCKDLPEIKVSRKAARDVWDGFAAMFVNANLHKRSVMGKSGQAQREMSTAIMPKVQFSHFVEQLKESVCLSMLISYMVKMRNILHDDIDTNIYSDYPTLWPTTLNNISAINKEEVSRATSQIINYALSVNASQPSWLKSNADIHYANGQHAAAIRYNLEAAMIVTDFFSHPVPRTIWNDSIYKRMIKCCSFLQCHTQAAILCQFLEQVDYTTAFKELQEKSCYDSMDALYEYIWDVTILEFLVYNHNKHGEVDKKQKAIQCIGKPELNTFNPEEILTEAAQRRKNEFLQTMAKHYLQV